MGAFEQSVGSGEVDLLVRAAVVRRVGREDEDVELEAPEDMVWE